MCYIDMDPCSFWKEEWCTAAKEHRCAECSSVIPPGRRYLRHFSVFEGSTCYGAICRPCATDRDRFFQAHGWGGTQAGSFYVWLVECVDDSYEDDVRWKMMRVRIEARMKKASEAQRAASSRASV